MPMKNSEISTVAISRNKEIQANIHTAMVRLNEFNGWKVGMPLMVKYYNEDHEVDTLFAVGVKDSGSSVIWKELSEVPSSFIDVPILPVDGGNTQTAYRERKFFKFKTYWDNADAVAVTYTWTLLSTEPPEGDHRVLYHVPVSSSEATPANPATKGWNDEIVKVVLGVEEGEDYDLSYYLSFNLAEVSYWRCRTNEAPGVIVPPDNKLPDDPVINAIYRITDYYVYENDTWRRIDESEISGEPVVVFELPEVGEPGVTYQIDEYYTFYGVWERLEYIPESYDILVDESKGEELPEIGETDKIYYVISDKDRPDKYYSCTHNGTSGRDFYDIISTKGIYAVDDVLELRPGISYALNGEHYLYYYETLEDKLADNGQWKIARRLGNSLGSGIPLGDKPRVFKNLSDNLKYFYQDGKLKRENDFITPSELAETPEIIELREQVDEIMNYLFPLTITITSGGGTYPDGELVRPRIFWTITRRDTTVQPTAATVNDSTEGVGSTFLGYSSSEVIDENTTYTIKVWYGRQEVSTTVTYTFV